VSVPLEFAKRLAEFLNGGGLDGRGIASIAVNGDGDLIINYTDGTTQNAGQVGGDGSYNLAADALFQDTRNDGKGARETLEGLFGVKVGMPANDDPNRIFVSGAAAPADHAYFDILIASTNTGGVSMVYGGQDLPMTNNPGTGTPMSPGQLVAGKIATIEISYGGLVFIWHGNRDPVLQAEIPDAPNPVGGRDADLIMNPWGNITFPGGVRAVGTINKSVLVAGSSNANADYVAAGAVPSQVAVDALNALSVGNGINYVAENLSAPGAPTSAAGGQLAGSASLMAGTAKWVFLFFWMNECRTIFYNDYGGFPAQIGAARNIIGYIRDHGAEPVLVAGFHPDPRASDTALDPFYFTGSGRDMAFPAFKANPVDPVNDMVPSASTTITTATAFTELRDWTGSGILRTGYTRAGHWNRSIRELGNELDCDVLDVEFASFRNTIETVPDLSAGLNTWYNQANPLHPLKAKYDASVTPLLQQWARAKIEGREDIRLFRGLASDWCT
jgi:hypothetical protein